MKNFYLPVLATLASTAFSSSAQAESIYDILERKAEATATQSNTTPPYTYVIQMDVQETAGNEEEGGNEMFSGKAKIDLSKPAGQRTEILYVSSEEENTEFLEYINSVNDPEATAAELADKFWCDGESDLFSKDGTFNRNNFTVISENDTEAVLGLSSKDMIAKMMEDDDEEQSSEDRKMMEKMVKKMAGEVKLSKPSGDLKAYKFWLTEPVTMKLIAKISKMNFSQGCAIAPNGRPYVSDVNMSLSGSAMTMKFSQNMKIKISDLQPN